MSWPVLTCFKLIFRILPDYSTGSLAFFRHRARELLHLPPNKCGCSAPSFTSSVTLRLVTAYVALPLVDWGWLLEHRCRDRINRRQEIGNKVPAIPSIPAGKELAGIGADIHPAG